MYKGDLDLEAFQKYIDLAKHKLYYNGDITNVKQFKKMQECFSSIDYFMICHGLIADQFSSSMIKNNSTDYLKNRWELFETFHKKIYQQYDATLSDSKSIKIMMLGFWEYFSQSFSNPHKTYKKNKKTSNP